MNSSFHRQENPKRADVPEVSLHAPRGSPVQILWPHLEGAGQGDALGRASLLSTHLGPGSLLSPLHELSNLMLIQLCAINIIICIVLDNITEALKIINLKY